MMLDWEEDFVLPRGRSYLHRDMNDPCCLVEFCLCCGKEELEAEIEETVGESRPSKAAPNLRKSVFADR